MVKKPEIFVCTNLRLSGASCAGQGGHDVLKALRATPAVRDGAVVVSPSVCMGYCGQGPNAKILGGDFYHGVTPASAPDLLDAAQKARADKGPADA